MKPTKIQKKNNYPRKDPAVWCEKNEKKIGHLVADGGILGPYPFSSTSSIAKAESPWMKTHKRFSLSSLNRIIV
jgi:hypothetical protein